MRRGYQPGTYGSAPPNPPSCGSSASRAQPRPEPPRGGSGVQPPRPELTEAMIRAGVEELAFSPIGEAARTAGGRALVRAIYRAMIAAK